MQLKIKHLEKAFDEKKVLTGISFQAESGKAFGLLGRNGAGKTTTIRILMGVFPADEGEVLLDDAPIDDKAVRIGYLPEERGLYPKKKVIDQLVYLAQLKGMNKRDATASVDRWLKRLDMEEYRGRRLDTLSKGNQQKIQLITTLAHDPGIIILDEPFSGLDPVNAMLLKDVVKEQIRQGKIVLFSSHQMNYIEEFCDSIAILHEGKIVLQGDIQAIKHSYVRNRLVVRTGKPDPIRAAFAKDCTTLEDGSLMIRLDAPEKKREVMNRLTEGFDIDEIKVYEPSLNDIFVEYTA